MSNLCVNPPQNTDLGNYIVAQETRIYSQVVSDVFGFHAVQYGWPTVNLIADSRMPHKHYVSCLPAGGHATLQAESEFLPFTEHSIDLVCLPHTLEQCGHPQQTLREVYRVLVADGVLVLTGMTPVSVLGVSARFVNCHGLGPITRQFTAWRIRDWLGVLGFEIQQSGYCMHALPVNDTHWLQRQSFLERIGAGSCGITGGIYYIVAKKRVMNVRLLRPDWKKTALTQALPVRKAQTPSQKQ